MPVELSSSPTSQNLATKPTKAATQALAELGAARYQSPHVVPPVATLNPAVVSNGLVINQALDSVAFAGFISTIGQPANSDRVSLAAGPLQLNRGEVTAVSSLQKTLSTLVQASGSVSPIFNLSDDAKGYSAASQSDSVSHVSHISEQANIASINLLETNFIDLSLISLGSSVPAIQSSNAPIKLTVIDGPATAVRIADFKITQTLPDVFINMNLAGLNLAVPTTTITSLSGPERSDLIVTGIEISTGITVSGIADGFSISLSVARVGANSQEISMTPSNLVSTDFAGRLNALAVNLTSEFAPLFLAEASGINEGQLQIRLTGVSTFADSDISPGTLILGG